MLLCTTTPSAPAQPCVISPSVKPLKTERLDSSLLRGSRGGSAASRRVCLTEHRGAKIRAQFALQRTGSRGRSRAVHRFAAVALPFQDVPRPAAHLRFSCAGGALHTPKGCFMCRRHASYPRRGALCAGGALHTPEGVLHTPEGVLHTPEGVLHVPKARLIAELCSAHSLLQPFGTKKSL